MNNYRANVAVPIEKTISAHGIAVFASDHDNYGNPAVSYSVGMERLGLPEIIVFGLTPDDGCTVVNLVAQAARKKWEGSGLAVLRHGAALGGILSDKPIGVVEVSESAARRYLGFANMLAVKDVLPVPAVQLVIPDSRKLWPWQRGHEYGFPVLGEVPASLS